MDGSEDHDWQKRYSDQQRYVKELEELKAKYEADWDRLANDELYRPAYEHIQKVAKGQYKPQAPEQPQQPEGPPKWFSEWTEKEWKPVRSDYETRQQKALREWTEKVEEREAGLKGQYPELDQQGWFGPKGKLNAWMAKTGEDDIEKAIRANLDPKYWFKPEGDESEPERKSKRAPSERPVEGKPPTKQEENVINAEQAINRARRRFQEQTGIGG